MSSDSPAKYGLDDLAKLSGTDWYIDSTIPKDMVFAYNRSSGHIGAYTRVAMLSDKTIVVYDNDNPENVLCVIDNED